MTVRINGVVPVIPVPFNEDESIDEASLRKAVKFVVSRRMAALCLPAYGSEFYKLSEAEREQVVGIAIDEADGRIPVVAQANHPSVRIAADLAKRYEQMGADLIGFALPRQFSATEQDLLAYCGRIADAISCPVVIQDFNPGGPTIGADFIMKANKRHANIAYFKLEEPMLIDKLTRIRDRVGDAVGILEGWGGYYMLEAIPAGICGIMPGVPICDLLDRVYLARKDGEDQRAYELFASILPFIAFTLQDIELFLQVEKRLMVRRGLFNSPKCRALTNSPSPGTLKHVEFLLDQMVLILEREGLCAVDEQEKASVK